MTDARACLDTLRGLLASGVLGSADIAWELERIGEHLEATLQDETAASSHDEAMVLALMMSQMDRVKDPAAQRRILMYLTMKYVSLSTALAVGAATQAKSEKTRTA